MNSLSTLPLRFWKKVRVLDNGCWEWVGARSDGYGQVWNGTHQTYAHRWVYEALVAPIPSGLQTDHLCRNHSCVNPRHLEAVTGQTNVRRGVRPSQMRAITHCRKGHPYSGDNLYVRPGKSYAPPS